MNEQPVPYAKIVFVCVNERDPDARVCCAAGGGKALHQRLKGMVRERGLNLRIRVSQSGCQNRCEDGPNIMVFPDNVWYSGVREEDLPFILDRIAESV